MNKKQKRVVFCKKALTKSVDGERRIVFVATSENVDRGYETVDVGSLRLPLKAGGEVRVDALPSEGLSGVIDIPLMVDHSPSARDIIGSVRSASYTNGELVFEAGLSSRELAQDIMVLIDEGHLSNAFSITMADYDYNFDSGQISNAEIIEVSVVYRGSNKDARLLSVKSLEGTMPPKQDTIAKQNDTFGDATGDGVDHTPERLNCANCSESQDKKAEEVTAPEEDAKAENKKTETKTDAEAEEVDAGVKEEKETDETEKGEVMNKQKSIAQDDVVEKSAAPEQPAAVKGYLKTKAALADFKNIVLKHHRGSNEAIMREWGENLKYKGVSGDAILPSAIEQIFFKAWVDNPGILSTFRTLSVRAGSVYAMTTEDTAQGHKKGDTKDDQTLTAVRRDLKAVAIYKKLPIDLQDLFDDETGELLAFRVEELSARVANAIAVGAIVGQGSGDKATKQGGRGLYPMLADINDSNGFGSHVATKITASDEESIYEHALRAIGAVKDEMNKGVVLIVPTGFKTELRLLKNKSGNLMFPIGLDIEAALGVKAIFEVDELVDHSSKLKAVAYVDQSYVLVGETTSSVRTDFDINRNVDIMLVERYVGGSQQGYKTLAGVVGS